MLGSAGQPKGAGNMAYLDTAVAFFTVMALILLGFVPTVGRFYHNFNHGLATWLRKVGLFSGIDVSSELHRIDILRIALGAIVTFHYWSELSSTYVYGSGADIAMLVIVVILSFSLMVGFLTPIVATALLLVINTILPSVTSSLSIGTMVIGMCLIPMVIAPAGHTMSVDAVLMRCRPLAGIYRIWGLPTVDRAQIGRFLALLSFSAINLYSGLNHLGSVTWRSGLSTGTILLFETSNRKYFEIAQWVYESAPWLYVSLSFFTTWGMIIWQIFFLALVLLSRWTRWAAMIWAVCFFVASAHVLSIKMLGIYEYVLFAIIFWSSWMMTPQRTTNVLFDDRCNLCDRTVKTIGFIDVFRRVEFRPLSKNLSFARDHNVSEEEAMADLVGITDEGAIFRGYDLYIRLASQVLFLLPLWPILVLGKALYVGPVVYRYIAVRRRSIFGVCELGSYRPRKEWAPLTAPERPAVAAGMMGAFAILVVPFITSLPHLNAVFGEGGRYLRETIGSPHSVFGIGPIDVFNELDLRIYRGLVRFSLFDETSVESRVDMSLSEIEQTKLTLSLRIAATEDAYCSEDFAKAMIGHLDRTLSKDDPRRGYAAAAIFKVAAHPNAEDFISFRHAPVEFDEVCRVVGKAGELGSLNTIYSPEYQQQKSNASLN